MNQILGQHLSPSHCNLLLLLLLFIHCIHLISSNPKRFDYEISKLNQLREIYVLNEGIENVGIR